MAWQLYQGDALETLKQMEDESINCCVTSPPYWGLRDYGVDGQLGIEETPEEYVSKMVEVFREVKRVLRKDGTLWLNLGDSYYNYRPGKGQALVKQTVSKTKQDLPNTYPRRGNKLVGLKEKDLVGIPWMVAFALRADGWYLRSDIIWAKPNPLPESVTDRPTKAHEYIFLLTKKQKYFYDAEAIKEPSNWDGKSGNKNYRGYEGREGATMNTLNRFNGARNKRTVWTVSTQPYPEAHFATFPPKLIVPCILAGCPEGGLVLDPFAGAGTTLYVAEQLGRNSIGIELNPDYCDIIRRRMAGLEMNLFLAK